MGAGGAVGGDGTAGGPLVGAARAAEVAWTRARTVDSRFGVGTIRAGGVGEQLANSNAADASMRRTTEGYCPRRQTVAQYLTYWLEEGARPKLKPSTCASYQRLLKAHIIPPLGKHHLTKLGPQHVQEFLNQKAASGLAPRTVQYLYAILRTALNRAVKWQFVARNVALLVDPPRVPKVTVQVSTPEAAGQFLAAAEDHRLEHLFAFLLSTGLRLGEALALRWQVVDLDASTISVHHTLEKLTGQPWRLVEPKSESGRRTIPLIGPAMAALRAQKVWVAEVRLHAGPAWEDHGFVFASTVGSPLDGVNVYHEYKKGSGQSGPTLHPPRPGPSTQHRYIPAGGWSRSTDRDGADGAQPDQHDPALPARPAQHDQRRGHSAGGCVPEGSPGGGVALLPG